MRRLLRVVLVLTSASAIIMQAPEPAAGAAYPGQNGLLLFEAWGAAGYSNFGSTAPAYDLWTVAADGSGLTNITNTLGVEADAQWSPDGTRIAFTSNRTGNYDIYVMRPDGSDLEQLTSSPSHETYPTWSPTGHRIAYVTDRARRPEIMVMRSDGRRKRSVGVFSGNVWHLSWSPVAPRIAFVRESTVEGYFAPDDDEDIYIVNVRTERVRVLVNEAVPEFDPVWSPSGRSIAFARDYCRDVSRCDNSEIMTVRPDGSRLTRITRTPALTEFDPAWSPDGTTIAYARWDEEWLDVELFLMGADGTDQRPLVAKPDSLDYQVDWQPVR